MFTYLINDSGSLIQRIVIVREIITFYAKPFNENILQFAEILDGFIEEFEKHFNAHSVRNNNANHLDEFHCCAEDIHYEKAYWAHTHSQFSKKIDEKILKKILIYMNENNQYLISKNTWFMSKERAKHIYKCFIESRENNQEKWFDMALPLGIAFSETNVQGFTSGFTSMLFLQALTIAANKFNFSKEQAIYLSNIATGVMLFYITDSVELSLTVTFINILLERAGIPKAAIQMTNIIAGNTYSACQSTVFIEDTATRGFGSLFGSACGALFGYGVSTFFNSACARASNLLGSRNQQMNTDHSIDMSPTLTTSNKIVN